jgi:hypothetical protein
MNCPRCRALIVANDVNLEHLLAKCGSCQEVFRFAPEEIEAVTDRVLERIVSPNPLRKAKAPRPGSILVEDWGLDRRLVKNWFSSGVVGMLMFCIFWDGFLFFWYFIAFNNDGPWMMVIFPLLHVAVGVTMTYSTIAHSFNRTEITLSEGLLEVYQGPVPWPGNISMPTGAIEQLYCMFDSATWFRNQNRPQPTMVTVNALMANGTRASIVKSLTLDEGLFIEQQLEEWLEITPRRVPGQVD